MTEFIFCDIRYRSSLFRQGNILDLEIDAVVSPANSFGFMDGGIDWHYTKRFGPGLQVSLQKTISYLPFGELLVGQALLVETGDEKIPYCISAPTMRVPKIIHDPNDIYLASRAAAKIAIDNSLKSVAFPGMGTGCGMVPFEIAEKAMKKGIEDALNSPSFASWRSAQDYHNSF